MLSVNKVSYISGGLFWKVVLVRPTISRVACLLVPCRATMVHHISCSLLRRPVLHRASYRSSAIFQMVLSEYVSRVSYNLSSIHDKCIFWCIHVFLALVQFIIHSCQFGHTSLRVSAYQWLVFFVNEWHYKAYIYVFLININIIGFPGNSDDVIVINYYIRYTKHIYL